MKDDWRTRFPQFEPVGRDTVQEQVYSKLKKALMRGDFVPGESLTVHRLAKAFGTSPMPVREALKRLLAAGALESVPNRSVAVPPLTEDKLRDLLRVRTAIEGETTGWAAQTIEPGELARLRSLSHEMDRMVAERDYENYLSLNQAFHFCIYEAARSPTIIPIIESLWLQIGPYLNLLYRQGELQAGNEHHNAALAALEQGRAGSAREGIVRDLAEAAEILFPILREREKP